MRLRLRIERNELPAVQVLWAIPDTELKQTVAQFLERVDERIPLEGESWGLEDYAVTVSGYEALHFSEIGTSFNNEDEVVIKPLQFVDKRARTMTGRDQITGDGRHLLDGVPFGRPALKRPLRPEVRIPPRKRQKKEGSLAAVMEAMDQALVRAGVQEEDEDDDEDDDDDMDFEMDEDEEDEEGADSDSEGESEEADQTAAKRRRSLRSQHTAEEIEVDGENSNDSDSDSSGSSGSSDEDDSNDSSSDSSSDSSDMSSETSWNGIESSDPKLTNGRLSTTPSNTSDDSPPEEVPSKQASVVPPREGEPKTHARNQRRREQRQLRHLKEASVLPLEAGLSDMKKWQAEQGLTDGRAVKSAVEQHRELEVKRQKLLDDLASGGIDVTDAEDEQRRGRAPDENDAVVNGTPKTNGAASDHKEQSVGGEERVEADRVPVSTAPATQRRARIDLAGTNRLVFGSLGVRAPKSQADKDRLQQKLSTRATRNAPAQQPEQVQAAAEEAEDDDPEAWRNKIDLIAVECCDEGVTLSNPPFPFVQRWDPQYQPVSKKRSGKSANGKARKRRRMDAGVVEETYDKYDTINGDALDYDDSEDDFDDDEDEYWEDGALLDGNGSDEVMGDGFPASPENLDALPSVLLQDASVGDYVAYKELACSQATGWQPKEIVRVAKLESKSHAGDSWIVTYPRRDRPPKRYDGEGNRVYIKFEVPGASDDEDDEEGGILASAPGMDVKLLQRAASAGGD